MNRAPKFRVFFLLAVLLLSGLIVLLREHRPSFLRPDLHSRAYVGLADGTVAVVDIPSLAVIARAQAGPGLSGMREHPTRAEIWGTSPQGGYVWVLDARTNQIAAKIPVGALPYSVDFSADGTHAYTTSAGADLLVEIDCASRTVIGRGRTGAGPAVAHVTPDGKMVLVVNRRDGTLGIHEAETLKEIAEVPVISEPEDVAILPDSSVAFVMSRTEKRLSVVDLKKGVLLTNLELAGNPSEMLLKPDGGELYVIEPEAHGLQAINTWTHEAGDYLVLGSAPTRGVLLPDASEMYVSDAAANSVIPVDIVNRRVSRPVAAGQTPGALRFDPGEKPRLLLVANEGSGDIAVIRITSGQTDNLITMIPVGDRPGEIAVKLF